MKKYAKVINEETKLCEVGLGNNFAFYQSIGMAEMDVEQGYDGNWYIEGFAPIKPESTKEEVEAIRRQLYITEVDPVTSHINRLRDENQTNEIIAEIEALKIKRAELVAFIRQENPYPA